MFMKEMFRELAITATELEEIHPQLNLTSQSIDWDQYLYCTYTVSSSKI